MSASARAASDLTPFPDSPSPSPPHIPPRPLWRPQNASTYKHYERWATANGFSRQNIVNDGTTSGTGGIGAVADFDLVVRSRKLDEDILVVAGDMYFNPSSFDLDGILRYSKSRDGSLVCYYTLSDDEDASARGICEVDDNNRVTAFYEKPAPGAYVRGGRGGDGGAWKGTQVGSPRSKRRPPRADGPSFLFRRFSPCPQARPLLGWPVWSST